jgi:hypothetical protein
MSPSIIPWLAWCMVASGAIATTFSVALIVAGIREEMREGAAGLDRTARMALTWLAICALAGLTSLVGGLIVLVRLYLAGGAV